jgi:chemotaxis protein MotB
MSRESYANLHASQAIEDLLADHRNDSNQQSWLLSYLDVFVLIIMLVITLLAMTDKTIPSQTKQTTKKIAQKQSRPIRKNSESILAINKTAQPKFAAHSSKKREIKKRYTLNTKSTLPQLTEKKLATNEIKTIKKETVNPAQEKSTAITRKKLEIKEPPPLTPKIYPPHVIAKKIEPEHENTAIKTKQEKIINSVSNETNTIESYLNTDKPAIHESKKPEEKWQDRLKKKLDHFEFINVKINQGYAQIEIQDNILFDSAEALLTEDGKEILKKLTALLKQSTGIIFIEGHTDNQPIATEQFPSNWELGSARATSVLHFLISQDLNSQRLRAVTYADTMPIADNFSEESRRKNRRVNLLVKIPET